MAVAFVQHVNNRTTTAGTTQSFTLPGAVTVGNTLVLFYAHADETITASVTSSTGWTTLIGPVDHSTQNWRGYVFVKGAAEAGDTTVTVTASGVGSANRFGVLHEYSGANTTTPTSDYDSLEYETATTPLSGPASNPTVDGMIAAAFLNNSSFTADPTLGGGFTQASYSLNMLSGYQAATASSTYTPTMAHPGATERGWAFVIAVAQAGTAATPVPKRLALLGTG